MSKVRSRKSWGHKLKHAWVALTGHKNVFVHHTAGSCPKTVAQEAEALQAVDSQHHGQGWAGIGYNFAVAQSGRKWAGRGWKWMGAHNDDSNSTTYGIVALGNFSEVKPTDDLVDAIVEVIKLGQKEGRIRKRPRVRGHRDTDSTECPGNHLYKQLDEIRRRVNGRR